MISDKANRLKSNLDLIALEARAKFGPADLRGDYAKVVDYVDREEILAQVRQKAAIGGSAADDLEKVAAWLDRRFINGPVR